MNTNFLTVACNYSPLVTLTFSVEQDKVGVCVRVVSIQFPTMFKVGVEERYFNNSGVATYERSRLVVVLPGDLAHNSEHAINEGHVYKDSHPQTH